VEYAAQIRLRAEAEQKGKQPLTGRELFFQNCAACHAESKVFVGPAMQEIRQIYEGRPDGVVAWAKNPGKKRKDFPQMNSFAHLPDEQLKLISEYMLDASAGSEGASRPQDK